MPPAPAPPKAHYEDLLGGLAVDTFEPMTGGGLSQSIVGPFSPPERDRNSIYWENGRPRGATDVWRLECDEFMHRNTPYSESPAILIPETNPENGAVEVVIRARNLREPVKERIRIELDYVDCEAEAIVRHELGL